jgi:hypothetical protein
MIKCLIEFSSYLSTRLVEGCLRTLGKVDALNTVRLLVVPK